MVTEEQELDSSEQLSDIATGEKKMDLWKVYMDEVEVLAAVTNCANVTTDHYTHCTITPKMSVIVIFLKRKKRQAYHFRMLVQIANRKSFLVT